jgi:hypothetical protein
VTHPKTVFAALALITALAGCGNADTVAADETNKLCAAIKDTGHAQPCSVNPRDHTVNLVIDTSDEAARNLCAAIADKIKPTELSGQWKLQIYSPYRDDKPLGYCSLR